MLNHKKTAIAVLVFGSSAVFAGTMGPVCTPGAVTVPCPRSGWEFGAQALYLQTTEPGGYYYGANIVEAAVTDNPPISAQYQGVSNWGWGFMLEGAYYFNTGNDLNLNWYHINHAVDVQATGVDLDAYFFTDVTSYSIRHAPQWDAVNLEFGQLAHFGDVQNIRFHAGVEYLHLQRTRTISAQLIDNDITYALTAEDQYKFNGFGPRLGADYTYNWGNGLSMYAKGATALMVGSQSFAGSDYITEYGYTSTVSGTTTNVVPALEGKLGLSYDYALAQGDVSFDLGWMWVNYFNGLQGPYLSSDASRNSDGTTVQINYALQGPYVGLKWIGNLA